MHKLLEKKLVEKYPKIFENYGGDITKTCMGWGLSCGKGWFLLIDELCSKLETYDSVIAAQVKEKFGGLRFYIAGVPTELFDEIHELIREFEAKSFETCETCGQPGERRGGSWIRTICDKCDEQRQIFLRIRDEGKYAYCFDDTDHIVVYDPETEDPIFSGTFGEFMDIFANYLGLIEDPMIINHKPLWEQI